MKWNIAIVIATTTAAILLSGCSLLGFGIGTLMDNSARLTREVSVRESSDRLAAGEEVSCLMTDGEILSGGYAGIGVPGKDTLLTMLPAEPPADCERRSSVRRGDVLVMKQRGRDADTVLFVTAEDQRLYYSPLRERAIRVLLFANIETLIRCGGRDIAPPYEQRVEEGLFERAAAFRLTTPGGVHSLDTADIVSVRYESKPVTGRLIFGLAGLAVDLVVIITVVLSAVPGAIFGIAFKMFSG